MIHIQCKRQNGVVKEFLAYSNSRHHARFTVADSPSAVAGRPGAPAQPGAALRGSDGEGGRLGLHQARPGGGRGTGGGGARFRGLRGRAGPPPRARGPGSGAGARGCRPRAAGGARPRLGDGRVAGKVPGGRAGGRLAGRPAGPGAEAAGGNASAHLKATTPSPASSRRGRLSASPQARRRGPAAPRKTADSAENRRRTAGGGRRAGSASERGRAVAGGRGATCAPPSALRARAGASRGPAHARTLAVRPRLLKSATTP